MFKKIMSLALVFILVLGMAACGSGSKDGEGGTGGATGGALDQPPTPENPVTLKLGHAYALEDNIHKASLKFSELVKERTNGAIIIDCYGAGQLGTTSECIESVVNGNQAIAAEAINVLDTFQPLADIESYPFLFDSADNLVAFLESDLADELWEEIGGDYFKIIGAQYRGARYLQTTKPVRNINDLKGLKLRTASMPILNRPWAILGCSTTPMDFSELYTGLQQGAVEGQENPLFTSYAAGFADVEKYLANTQHVFGIVAFAFNKPLWESFSDEQRQILTETAEEVAAWRTQLEIDSEEEYIQDFLDAGLEWVEIEDLDDWKAALEEPLKEEFPNLQEWAAKIREFQDNL